MRLPKKMKVRVTKADVENSEILLNAIKSDEGEGGICHAQICPIACAFNRALPRGVFCQVGHFHARARKDGEDGVSFAVPEKVRRIIRKFDGGGGMEPFSFVLEREWQG